MMRTLVYRLLGILGCAVLLWGGVVAYTNFSKPKNPKTVQRKAPSASRAIFGTVARRDGEGAPSTGRSEITRFGATGDFSRMEKKGDFSSFDGDADFANFDPDNEYEEGELVVVDPPGNFSNTVRRLGFTVLEQTRLDALALTVFRVRIPRGVSVPDARRQLLSRFPSATVDANHRFDPSQERRPRTPRRTRRSRRSSAPVTAPAFRQRGKTLSVARAAIGWKNVPADCGKGVRIGMVDSGVDLSHPALAGQKIEFRSFHNPRRREGPADHGTAIAAMLVGKPSEKGWGGLLPGAHLVAANMFELDRTGRKVGNTIALLKSLNWILKKRVHAVNLSVAGSDNKILRKAMDRLRAKGLVMIASVGNWGRDDRPAYPAAYGHVVAVTAVGAYRSIYSRANRGDYIDFAAPGVKMLTAVPGGGVRRQSGTSFATPYLTALIALEVARNGKKNPAALRATMAKAVADLGAPGKDKVFGWGFIEKQPNCRI